MNPVLVPYVEKYEERHIDSIEPYVRDLIFAIQNTFSTKRYTEPTHWDLGRVPDGANVNEVLRKAVDTFTEVPHRCGTYINEISGKNIFMTIVPYSFLTRRCAENDTNTVLIFIVEKTSDDHKYPFPKIVPLTMELPGLRPMFDFGERGYRGYSIFENLFEYVKEAIRGLSTSKWNYSEIKLEVGTHTSTMMTDFGPQITMELTPTFCTKRQLWNVVKMFEEIFEDSCHRYVMNIPNMVHKSVSTNITFVGDDDLKIVVNVSM